MYEKFANWKNFPDESTPITAAALTHIEQGITDVDVTRPGSPAEVELSTRLSGVVGSKGEKGDKGDPGEPGKDGTVTPEMIALRDESVAAKNTTVSARDVAVTAKDDAVAAKLAAQAVGATNDAIMAGVAADPASAFSVNNTEMVNRKSRKATARAMVSVRTDVQKFVPPAEPMQMTVTPTYEGSGTAIHPSIYHNADRWNGYEYWMGMTPYPGGDTQTENPSILASHDGINWEVPTGLVNPLYPAPGALGYNSDTNLAELNGTLYLFWRSYLGREVLFYRSSTDGITWTPPVRVWDYDDKATGYRLMSPAFIPTPDGWTLYAVDIASVPFKVVRSQAATLSGPWSSLESVTITGNAVQPWHIDVHYVGGEWQMLVQDGSSAGGDLWPAVSADGRTFTAYPSPIIPRGSGWNPRYYKSCFLPVLHNGEYGWDVWVSGSGFSSGGSLIARTYFGFGAGAVGADLLGVKARVGSVEAGMGMLLATVPVYPWLVADTFNRPNGPIGTATTGDAWEATTSGTFVISDRAISPSADVNTRAFVGPVGAEVRVAVELIGDQRTRQSWVLARAVDNNNMYRFGIDPNVDPTKAAYVMQKIIGGAVTVIGRINNVLSGSHTIEIEVVGSTLKGYSGGKLVGTFTDAAISSGTKAGLQASEVGAKMRNFTVRAVGQ